MKVADDLTVHIRKGDLIAAMERHAESRRKDDTGTMAIERIEAMRDFVAMSADDIIAVPLDFYSTYVHDWRKHDE